MLLSKLLSHLWLFGDCVHVKKIVVASLKFSLKMQWYRFDL